MHVQHKNRQRGNLVQLGACVTLIIPAVLVHIRITIQTCTIFPARVVPGMYV